MKLSTLLESTDKKYEFVPDDTIIVSGSKLTRIRALIDIPKHVFKGNLGGYIEKESNLSHEGYCWVGENAKVLKNASVFGNAEIYGNAKVSGNAQVFDNARVSGEAKVSGEAILCNISWYHNSTLWLDSSTQESLNSFANDTQIKILIIKDCPITDIIGFNQVENLQLRKLDEFSVKTHPTKLTKLEIYSVKVLKHLPYLVNQKIELITNNSKFTKLIPEFIRLQNESDKELALYEMQDILIHAGFSEEEYRI